MKKLFKVLDAIVEAISDLAICALIAIAALQIVARYVLNNAFSWAEELSLMLFLWLAFFGMVIAMGREGHLRVDAFIMGLHPRIQHWLLLIAYAGACVISLFIAWVSFESAMKIMSRGQMASAMPLPLWIVWMAIPACFILSALQALRHFISKLTGKEL